MSKINKKEFFDRRDLLALVFKRLVSNNGWRQVISHKQKYSEIYYLAIFFLYKLLPGNDKDTRLELGKHFNILIADRTIQDILENEKCKLLFIDDKMDQKIRSKNNKIIDNYFQFLQKKPTFSQKPSDISKQGNIYYGGGFNPVKKIKELRQKKYQNMCFLKEGKVEKQVFSGDDFIMHNFFSSIFIRTYGTKYDEYISVLFLDMVEYILTKKGESMDMINDITYFLNEFDKEKCIQISEILGGNKQYINPDGFNMTLGEKNKLSKMWFELQFSIFQTSNTNEERMIYKNNMKGKILKYFFDKYCNEIKDYLFGSLPLKPSKLTERRSRKLSNALKSKVCKSQ